MPHHVFTNDAVTKSIDLVLETQRVLLLLPNCYAVHHISVPILKPFKKGIVNFDRYVSLLITPHHELYEQ